MTELQDKVDAVAQRNEYAKLVEIAHFEVIRAKLQFERALADLAMAERRIAELDKA